MGNVKFFTLGILLFFGLNVSAQKSYGLRGGANFATVTNIKDAGTINSFYVGAFKELPIIKKVLFVQPELQFSKQGYKTQTEDINLNYVNIPIMAKVYLVKFLSLETGPQFGIKVSDSSSDYSYNALDKAWAAGLGFHFPFGLSLEARYVGSFSEVSEDFNSAKNQVVQAGIGFRF